jgi:hypothetical protein
LDILTRATGWLVGTPFDTANSRVQEALEVMSESWNHKQPLLSALLSYMDHLPFSSNLRLASLCHRMLDILCGTDPACQVLVLRYLHEQFASRDAMQTSRFASHHVIAKDENNTSPEAMYYSFVSRFVLSVLAQGEGDQVPSAIDLAILIAKEILLLPTPTSAVLLLVVPMLKKIWEHAEFGQILRENHRLDVYVALVLTNGHPYLDTSSFSDLITLIFPHVAGNLPPNHRETIVRTLAEKIRYSIVYINQAANSLNNLPQDNNNPNSALPRLESIFASLVQSLKALSIVFADVVMKTQFVHEHNQLLTSLADMARSVSEEDVKSTPDSAPGVTSYLKSRLRAQDFVKLVSLVSSPSL